MSTMERKVKARAVRVDALRNIGLIILSSILRWILALRVDVKSIPKKCLYVSVSLAVMLLGMSALVLAMRVFIELLIFVSL